MPHLENKNGTKDVIPANGIDTWLQGFHSLRVVRSKYRRRQRPEVIQIPVAHLETEECIYEPLFCWNGTIRLIPQEPDNCRGRLR